MAHKIMVSCQKGGVGKTTTTAIMAEILAASDYRVLVIDLDTQGNSTQMLTQESIYKFSGETVLEAIKEGEPRKYILDIKKNISLLPSEDMLATFSRYVYTSGITKPSRVLKNAMEEIENDYDFILMDCPPNLGDIVLNALVYTDYVIVPVQLDAFGLDALDRYVSFVEEAKAEGHTEAEILGVVFTMRDTRSVIEKVIGESIRRTHHEKVFNAEIKKRAKLKEFALMGTTMERKNEIDALSDYFELTEEVINRVKTRLVTE